MSFHPKIGDKVRKKPNAGFIGEPLVCVIPDVRENQDPPPCFLCDNPDCNEWPTLWALDAEGKPFGPGVCHVSECELEPVE